MSSHSDNYIDYGWADGCHTKADRETRKGHAHHWRTLTAKDGTEYRAKVAADCPQETLDAIETMVTLAAKAVAEGTL